MALVVGNENYNWELLEANCEYKEGYTSDHPTIQHFWKAFRLAQKFNLEEYLSFNSSADLFLSVDATVSAAVELIILLYGNDGNP